MKQIGYVQGQGEAQIGLVDYIGKRVVVGLLPPQKGNSIEGFLQGINSEGDLIFRKEGAGEGDATVDNSFILKNGLWGFVEKKQLIVPASKYTRIKK